MTLTDAQRTAVKFYEGDVQGNDPFWGDAKAYVTLNSLFYPGVDTERRRATEGKRLNPAITANVERLLHVCTALLEACKAADLSQPRVAYRVERYADYLEMRQAGETISFTSTSTGGFLPAYGDRIGIALLEFRIPAGVPCLPFAEVLQGDYAKSDEQEILLPPGLPLSFADVEMSSQERSIVDARGDQPQVKCLVAVGGSNAPKAAGGSDIPRAAGGSNVPTVADDSAAHRAAMACVDDRDRLAQLLHDSIGPQSSACIYKALNSGFEPDPIDVERYCTWKEAFREEMLHRMGHPSTR